MSGGSRNKVQKKETGKTGKKTFSPVVCFLLFLFLAVAFHGLFFLLFRPLVTNRETVNTGRGFTLILTPENIKDHSAAYGLEYWLKYTQSPEELKMQQEASFTARIMHRKDNPLSQNKLMENLAAVKEHSFRDNRQNNGPEKKVILPAGQEKSLAVRDELFTGNTPAKKYGEQKKFPRWKFNTGKTFHGWHISGKAGKDLLALHKEKVNAPTLCRIEFAGKGLPPVCKLIRSCGVPELDEAAKRELLVLAGTYKPEKGSSRMYCTILWGEELLYRNMKDRNSGNAKKEDNSRRNPVK